MLLNLSSCGVFSGREVIKCTKKCAKDKTNEREKTEFWKKEQFLLLFFGRATLLRKQQQVCP